MGLGLSSFKLMTGVVVNQNKITWEEFLKLKDSHEPFIRFNVVTGSMEPLIPVGTSIIVDPKADYKVNDIIVFWQNDKMIVHIFWHTNKSIKLKDKDILITRALNSRKLDLSITREQVLGKVVSHKLGIKNLLNLYVFKKFKKY